jgi:paraquat-inducible protein B
VVAVRTCEVVATGPRPWRRAIVTAARETAAAPGKGLLLAVGTGLAVLLVWMLPILALVVAGPLALAAVATGGRR